LEAALRAGVDIIADCWRDPYVHALESATPAAMFQILYDHGIHPKELDDIHEYAARGDHLDAWIWLSARGFLPGGDPMSIYRHFFATRILEVSGNSQ
jgi:hypothetical protein